MNVKKKVKIAIYLVCFFGTVVARADIKLPAILSNHMVLQQKAEVTLWGWAEAREDIEIIASWQAQPLRIKANGDGKWQIKIKTIKAGGPYQIVFKGNNEVLVKDVYLGEVWFCSGQSNMAWTIASSNQSDSISQAATNSLIRMFTVQRAVADNPQEDVKGIWAINSPTAVKRFSAVAYHFGNELAMRLKVPIGLIHSSWGGTPAESWVSKEVLHSDESYKPIYGRQQAREQKYETEKAKNPSAETLKDPKTDGKSSSVLYNAMVKPLVNYKINGIIWYQGESNANRAYQYRKLFPQLIRSWREEFKGGGLPFYYVQIAPFKGQNPEIREAQLMTLQTSDFVGMAVTTDVGDCEDIHPKNKLQVGKRLAYIALNNRYGDKSVQHLSPLYSHYEVLNDKIKVHFDTESNLISKNGTLKDFVIAGEDQKFYPAVAEIQGKTVVVSSSQVKKPVAVRFGWKNCPDTNLFNGAGFPASPFRTDQWKGTTEGKY